MNACSTTLADRRRRLHEPEGELAQPLQQLAQLGPAVLHVLHEGLEPGVAVEGGGPVGELLADVHQRAGHVIGQRGEAEEQPEQPLGHVGRDGEQVLQHRDGVDPHVLEELDEDRVLEQVRALHEQVTDLGGDLRDEVPHRRQIGQQQLDGLLQPGQHPVGGRRPQLQELALQPEDEPGEALRGGAQLAHRVVEVAQRLPTGRAHRQRRLGRLPLRLDHRLGGLGQRERSLPALLLLSPLGVGDPALGVGHPLLGGGQPLLGVGHLLRGVHPGPGQVLLGPGVGPLGVGHLLLRVGDLADGVRPGLLQVLGGPLLRLLGVGHPLLRGGQRLLRRLHPGGALDALLVGLGALGAQLLLAPLEVLQAQLLALQPDAGLLDLGRGGPRVGPQQVQLLLRLGDVEDGLPLIQGIAPDR
jgi:hypothetical protein